MHCKLDRLALMFLGSVISLAAQATVVEYTAGQGVDVTKLGVAPPPLTQAVSDKITAFTSAIDVLGRQEFEAGSIDFSYTGGTATSSANPANAIAVITGSQLNAPNGRYNTTTGLGATDRGHYLENSKSSTVSSASFTYGFSSAISAFAFFATDLGDVKGGLTVDFYSGGVNGTDLFSKSLTNSAADASGLTNGNLLFYGITSTVAFDTVVFRLAGTASDAVGFDSLIVGNLAATTPPPQNVPEPASIALVGLAMVGLRYAGKRVTKA